MRRRGPGLIGTTAVVVGTANVVNRAMAPKPQQYAPPPEQYAPPPQQYAPSQPEVVYVQAPPSAAPAAPAGGITQDQINQLQQIAQLKDQGILTEQEFQAQKAKILAG